MQRNIVSYYDLSEEWQEEALSNLDEEAYNAYYLEPEDDDKPEVHILWDLSECVSLPCEHEDVNYTSLISISNNSAMLLQIDDNFESAKIAFV